MCPGQRRLEELFEIPFSLCGAKLSLRSWVGFGVCDFSMEDLLNSGFGDGGLYSIVVWRVFCDFRI